MSVITSTPGQIQVIKRTGDVAHLMQRKFLLRLESFLAVEGQQGADSSRIHDRISQLTEMVLNTLIAVYLLAVRFISKKFKIKLNLH
jgi:ribonucleoside-diphosphate reductase alpha chain